MFHYVTEIRQAEEDKEYMFSFVHGSKNDFTEAGSRIVIIRGWRGCRGEGGKEEG